MSRGDGFAIADVATDLLDDAKVKRLWRLLAPDQCAMSRAMMLHQATLLASWGDGCRVTVDEATPLWLELDEALVEALIRVGMIDRSRRLPARSWKRWFEPARGRREARRAAGHTGGVASGKAREAKPKQPLTVAEPVRPSGRTVVSSSKPLSRGRVREEGAAPRSNGIETARAILQRNGTLPVKDGDGLLAEPMPPDVSADIPVEVLA